MSIRSSMADAADYWTIAHQPAYLKANHAAEFAASLRKTYERRGCRWPERPL
ncbi:MAG: hypothetical protein WCK89_20310 [bacterium]